MSQALIDAAKASILGYNDKNWDAVNGACASDLTYDEVATHRTVKGAADVISVWKGWAATFPDSRATFDSAHVAGNSVILEVTWRGTQTGPLQTPAGDIPATGKNVELRSCLIFDIADGKARSLRQYFDMATMLSQLGVNTVGV